MRFVQLTLIISVLFLFVSCAQKKNDSNQQSTKKKTRHKIKHVNYANAIYDITLTFPQRWIILENQHLDVGQYTINIFNKNTSAEAHIPLGLHEPFSFSYIAIWPEGLSTELPFGEYSNFKDELKLHFNINRDESKQLLLKNGTAWGYFIVPESPPENWSDHGFIYAQIEIKNGNTTCIDGQSGKRKPIENCDLMGGKDKMVRTGRINKKSAETIREILESIKFEKVDKKTWAGDYVKVQKPLPNTIVTSPLAVVGKARSSWYFEGVFPVKLIDASGDLLAEGIAEAQEPWMTNGFVPFKATLNFNDAPDDERGQLLLIKANPSGLARHADTLSVSVIFE